jgi:hypothetical protein
MRAMFLVLLIGCAGSIDREQQKALAIACDVISDLKERGIDSSLSYAEIEGVRARAYSNALHALKDDGGLAQDQLAPPRACPP